MCVNEILIASPGLQLAIDSTYLGPARMAVADLVWWAIEENRDTDRAPSRHGKSERPVQLGVAHFTSYRTTSARRTDPARLAVLLVKLHGTSATSYAMMGASQEGDKSLKHADGQPGTAYETGSSGLCNASIHLQFGRLNKAAEWAAAALNGFDGQHRRGHIAAELMQAEIFLRTGDSHGSKLAAETLDRACGVIQSQALRQRRLLPLAQALSGRKDSQREDLGRIAHQLATQG
ncbi:MAG: hypothetical protein JO345_15655 [Streptosporangiaceae bacterium]|nr:hypothetical protein [Streptosporangiaceae bacterium]